MGYGSLSLSLTGVYATSTSKQRRRAFLSRGVHIFVLMNDERRPCWGWIREGVTPSYQGPIQEFAMGGGFHGERGARAYNGGLTTFYKTRIIFRVKNV